MKPASTLVAIFLLANVLLCAGLVAQRGSDEAIKKASAAITGEGILSRIRALADDKLEGRAPGTPGEDATVAYLEREAKRIGLEPGNPNGKYTQEVPLVGIMSTWTGSVQVGETTIALRFGDDYAPASLRIEPETRVQASPIVFVGYGVQAPEYGWDDYKGLDVRGKTLMMLVNDPAIPDPANPSQLDPKMFKGRAMTYYGRWTYKFEIASKLGASAVLLIHETGPAGYPWEVPKAGSVGEAFDIKPADRNMSRVAVESWIHLDKARQILSAAGQDIDALKAAALRRDFKPVSLNAQASFLAKKTIREVQSRNVVAKLTGSDPRIVTSTSPTRRTGITLDEIPRCRATRFTTAPSTTPRGPRWCWALRRRSRRSSRARRGPCCFSGSPPRSAGCSDRSTTPARRSTR